MDQADRMDHIIQTIELADLPESMRNIENPPARLYVRSANEQTFESLMRRRRVAIVGSRSATAYGETVTHRLASELAAHGVVIVSGLAIGIDGIAHRAALEVGGLTFAVLPSSVTRIHPRSHIRLSNELIGTGGMLVSEYPPDTITFKNNFVARNRIVSGLADVLLITEAAVNSGTMHTARFALRQGRDVMAVPGSITSEMSEGTNNLIKAGATPVTNTTDVLHYLGMEASSDASGKRQRQRGRNLEEQQLLDLIEEGVHQGGELLERSGFTIEQFNHHLTMLEITAKVRPLGANQWALQ